LARPLSPDEVQRGFPKQRQQPIRENKLRLIGGHPLAVVVDASDGADAAPLNALTQARSLPRIDPMARDLIATILDADEETFDIKVVYYLPADVSDLVNEAKGAREWADAAQELWHERSAVAAEALAERGYSLRETATLLGLSHQRVDQILGSNIDREGPNSSVSSSPDRLHADIGWPNDVQCLVVFRNFLVHDKRSDSPDEHLVAQIRGKLRALAEKAASQLQQQAEAELRGAEGT
jgi:hypothetical protein